MFPPCSTAARSTKPLSTFLQPREVRVRGVLSRPAVSTVTPTSQRSSDILPAHSHRHCESSHPSRCLTLIPADLRFAKNASQCNNHWSHLLQYKHYCSLHFHRSTIGRLAKVMSYITCKFSLLHSGLDRKVCLDGRGSISIIAKLSSHRKHAFRSQIGGRRKYRSVLWIR